MRASTSASPRIPSTSSRRTPTRTCTPAPSSSGARAPRDERTRERSARSSSSPGCATPPGPYDEQPIRNRRLLAALELHELVVETDDEDRRHPLADEVGDITLAEQHQHQRAHHRGDRSREIGPRRDLRGLRLDHLRDVAFALVRTVTRERTRCFHQKDPPCWLCCVLA